MFLVHEDHHSFLISVDVLNLFITMHDIGPHEDIIQFISSINTFKDLWEHRYKRVHGSSWLILTDP
jgi:hypothetical protein